MNIPIKLKSNYGRECVYVADATIAENIFELTGRKTLSASDFFALKNLGHTFSVDNSAPIWLQRLI